MARKIRGRWSGPSYSGSKEWTLYHPETNEELGTLYARESLSGNNIEYQFCKTLPTNNYYGKTVEKIIFVKPDKKIKDERDAMAYIETLIDFEKGR